MAYPVSEGRKQGAHIGECRELESVSVDLGAMVPKQGLPNLGVLSNVTPEPTRRGESGELA